ncbi:UNVERIFIED_CONTAM: hypothetical protein RMT77_008209 [Armadillidium vulgare]
MLHFLLLLLVTGHSDGSHLIELDFEFGPEVPIYPLPKFKHFIIEKTKEGYDLNDNWIATQKITADEHTGTHIDAPLQFYEHGRDLDEIPLDKLFGPGVVIDISEKVKSNSTYKMTAEDVHDWVAEHGMFPNNSIILIHTGWSSRWPHQLEYFGTAGTSPLAVYPGASLESVETLFSFKDSHNIHIETIGIDSPALRLVTHENSDPYRYAAIRNACVLNMLNNLHLLPPKGSNIIIMPMKIKGGTGAPARVWARIPSSINDL